MSFKPLVAVSGPRRLVQASDAYEVYNVDRDIYNPVARIVNGKVKDGYEHDPDFKWALEQIRG